MKVRLFASLSLGFWLLVCGWPKSAMAQTIVFQDDFSNGFEKWETARTRPELWKTVDGQAEAVVKTPSTIVEMVPKDAFWNPEWRDLDYELDYTPLEGVDKNISFNFSSLQSWYELHFVESYYNLVRVLNGTVPFSVDRPFTMVNGQTYHLKVRFDHGLISIWVNDEKIGEEFDFTFTNEYGKIGIKAGTGSVTPTRVRFDNVVVTTLASPAPQTSPSPSPSPSPTVTVLKQTDPSWSSQEYDTAHAWTNTPSLGRWGCALTSATMIFRYHGLTKLPDGSELTPATLNAWLTSQADGFVGQSALNWLALTRLSKQISEVWQTPALEYLAVVGSDETLAHQEVAAGRPVVLQLPKHFTVADGELGQDLSIKDPAFAFTKLSQHHSQVLSTRLFIPSHTDLSYVLFVHQPQLQISVKNVAGQTLTTQTFIDSIQGLDSPQQLPTTAQTMISKPQPGRYTLELSQNKLAPYSLKIWVYDQQGQATLLNTTGVVGTQAKTLTLSISSQPTQPATLQSQMTWQSWRRQITYAWQVRKMTSRLFYQYLLNATELAPRLSKNHQKQLLAIIKMALQLCQKRDISPEAKQLLLETLPL